MGEQANSCGGAIAQTLESLRGKPFGGTVIHIQVISFELMQHNTIHKLHFTANSV